MASKGLIASILLRAPYRSSKGPCDFLHVPVCCLSWQQRAVELLTSSCVLLVGTSKGPCSARTTTCGDKRAYNELPRQRAGLLYEFPCSRSLLSGLSLSILTPSRGMAQPDDTSARANDSMESLTLETRDTPESLIVSAAASSADLSPRASEIDQHVAAASEHSSASTEPSISTLEREQTPEGSTVTLSIDWEWIGTFSDTHLV